MQELTPIALIDPWPSRVDGGIATIPLDELATTTDLPDGAAVALRDEAGTTRGYGIVDRENQVLRVLPASEGTEFGPALFAERAKRAIALRRRLGLIEPDSACRLIHGGGDLLSGLIADYYAGHVIIYTYGASYAPYVRWLADAIATSLSPASITWKVRPAGPTPTGRIEPELLFGEAPPQALIVREDAARYEVHPHGGLNTGLFCDMREVRRALAPWSHDARVLNTFAYTGSFSVVCAMAGAAQVTTVEFASGVLNWAKTNFTLNGLDVRSQRYRFVRGDVFDFLKTARRSENRFDIVVLDPPVSTPVPGRRWHAKSDYGRLIAHALRVTEPGGLVVVAASSLLSRPEGIETQIRQAGRETGRRLLLVGQFGLPPDFPTPMISPQERYLKCYFLRAE